LKPNIFLNRNIAKIAAVLFVLFAVSGCLKDDFNKLSDSENVKKQLTNELRVAQEKSRAAPQSP
jgi:hypothetical protein